MEALNNNEVYIEDIVNKELGFILQDKGYNMIPSNVPEYTVYFQVSNNLVHMIQAVTVHKNFVVTEEQYNHVKKSIYKLFEDKGYDNIHILTVIISDEPDRVKALTENDTFCWILKPSTRQLIIYENQVVDFYGVRNLIENMLSTESILNRVSQEKNEILSEKPKKSLLEIPFITIGITAINIGVFLICTFTGDLLYNIGALNAINVIEYREFYRIITCMFLHADVHHLFSNMVMYYFLGEIVEKNLGHVKYLLLYFLSGFGGGILSMLFSIVTNSNIDSVGASGAIFGIVGALLWLALIRKDNLEHITLGKVLFLIIYSLYSGFTGTNIDNAAHIGGLITGFLFTFGTRGLKNEG